MCLSFSLKLSNCPKSLFAFLSIANKLSYVNYPGYSPSAKIDNAKCPHLNDRTIMPKNGNNCLCQVFILRNIYIFLRVNSWHKQLYFIFCFTILWKCENIYLHLWLLFQKHEKLNNFQISTHILHLYWRLVSTLTKKNLNTIDNLQYPSTFIGIR